VGAAVDVLREAGVGLDADQAGGRLAEEAHVLDHEVGAGGAVEADDVDGQDSRTATAAAMSVPTSMVPVVSTVTWTSTGTSRPRLGADARGGERGALDLEDVLRRSRSGRRRRRRR
jgi:hypothetical protein